MTPPTRTWYWRHMGTTHGQLEHGQQGPLYAQVMHSLAPAQYRVCLTAYRATYHHAMQAIECAVSEREHIARRHRRILKGGHHEL